MSGIRERWVRVDGYRTRYVEAGDGEPLVLVHGGGPGASWRVWRAVMPGLAARYRVVAPDMLGFGETDKPPLEYTEWRVAAHLGAFADALSLDGVRIAGASKGAYWAARVTVERPDLIRALCAIGTNTLARAMGVRAIPTPGFRLLDAYDGSLDQMRRFVSTVLLKAEVEPVAVERHRLASLPGFAEVWASQVQAARRMGTDPNYWQAFSLETRLPKMTTPMLLVWGARDAFAPVEMAHELARLLPNMPLRLMPETGHQCYNDDPEAFTHILLDFLASASPAASPARAAARIGGAS